MGAQTLVSTLMSEVANSYVDLAYADAYWEDDYRANLSAQWAALSDGQKTSALVDACDVLESLRFTLPNGMRDYSLFLRPQRTQLLQGMLIVSMKPYKLIYSQRLQFPRNLDVYVSEPPSPELMGQPYIPESIKEAQCEQAAFLLTFDEGTYQNRLMASSRNQSD
jgi:hypothetical protein